MMQSEWSEILLDALGHHRGMLETRLKGLTLDELDELSNATALITEVVKEEFTSRIRASEARLKALSPTDWPAFAHRLLTATPEELRDDLKALDPELYSE